MDERRADRMANSAPTKKALPTSSSTPMAPPCTASALMMVPTPFQLWASTAWRSLRSSSSRSMPVASGRIAISAWPSWPRAPSTTVPAGFIGTTSASRGCALSASLTSAWARLIGHGMSAVSSARFR